MNELNKLYEAMLLSWGSLIKEEGKIVFAIDGQEYPLKIDNMNLHLPLSEVLDGNVMEKVFFHPACENITSKETEVFKIIRRITAMRLLDVFRRIPVVLFTVASGTPKKGWNQKTLDLLEPLKGAKQTVRGEVNKLFARMHIELEENGLDNRFIHFKITKGGVSKVTGQRIYYKTKPSFPFYTEIVRRLSRSEGQADNQTVELNNHTVSRAALKLAAHLFQVILPAVLSPDDYERESTDPVAARLVSYLEAYGEIADQMNKIQNTFRAEFDKAGLYTIDLNWLERLEELPDIHRQVPVMDYNSHNTRDDAHAHQQSNSNMGNLLSLTSQPNNQQQQYNNQGQQMQQQGNMLGDFDVTAPMMVNGDRWVKYEIDYANNRVLHHAIAVNGNPVIYMCSKKGNLLQRQEQNMANMMANGMMGGMGGMGMMGNMNLQGATQLPNGMILLPNGQVINPAMMGMMQQPSMPSAAPSVYVDQSGSGGLNDGQAWG